MKNCMFCKKPLNEFDLNFSNTLFPDEKMKNIQKCCSCTVGIDQYEKLQKIKDRKNLVYCHIWPLIGTLVWIASFVLAGIVIDNIWGDNYPRVFADAAGFLWGFPGIALIIVWICCGIAVVKSTFNIKPYKTSYGGSHTEITQTSSNTFKVEEVTDTYGEGGWNFGHILLVITYPLWCLLHLIYILTVGKKAYRNKALKIFPEEVINAYEHALKVTTPVKNISISPKQFKSFKKKQEKYIQDIDQTKEKYSILGQSAVDKQIEKLMIPIAPIKVDKEIHFMVDMVDYRSYYADDNPKFAIYLLRKNNRGEIEGTVVSELYKSPYSVNWEEEWSETKMDKRILEKIKIFARTKMAAMDRGSINNINIFKYKT